MNEEYTNLKEVLVIFGVSIFLFTLNSIGFFSDIRSFFSITFESIYTETRDYFSTINQYASVFNNISEVREENKTLRDRNQELESDLNELMIQLRDVSFVIEAGLTDFDSEQDLIPVRVLSYDIEDDGLIYINKGIKDGIDEDDIVILDRFAVGLVEEVSANYSKVNLILSGDYSINAISLENMTKGIFSGNMPDNFEVKDILNEEPLSQDDVFVTEGIDGIFPYGLYLGRVERSIGNPANPTKSASLSNSLDFRNLDRLYVMKFK